jgi:hypothetical protein
LNHFKVGWLVGKIGQQRLHPTTAMSRSSFKENLTVDSSSYVLPVSGYNSSQLSD